MADDVTDFMIRELRAMAIAGRDVSSLLRRIQEIMGHIDCKLVSVQCLRKAFNAGIASVSPVAGWSGFGGELSDERVNSLVVSVLDEYRRTAPQ